MADNNRFKVSLELLEDYVFKIDFDEFGYILSDEPPPLGAGEGPNPARLVAAAVANCLCASLLFALRKGKQQPQAISAVAEGSLERVDGRWRIEAIEVAMAVDEQSVDSGVLEKALTQFEDFCIVTQSIRQGIPIKVAVKNHAGELIHQG